MLELEFGLGFLLGCAYASILTNLVWYFILRKRND